MELVDKFIISPSVNQLSLSTYIILLSLLIQLPYMSLLLGLSCFSVFFRALGLVDGEPTYLRFSEMLPRTIIFNRYVVLMFGLVPLLSLYMSLSQYLVSSNIRLSYFFALLVPAMLAGCVLVLAYQHLLHSKPEGYRPTILAGFAGVGMLLLSSFVLLSVISFVINFERRFFTQDLARLLLSWNGIARFKLFLALALALSGAAALALGSGLLKVNGYTQSEELMAFAKKVGTVSVYASIILAPVVALAYFFTLPSIAVSPAVIFTTLAFFATLVGAFFLLQRADKLAATLVPAALFLALLVSFSIATVSDVLSMENSTREHVKELIIKAEAYKAKLAEELEAKAEKSADKTNLGEQIFNNRCSACHKYDSRLVGPPFNQVLPKYKGKEDELVSFISNPTKKNPDYPPMPNPGLSHQEAEAAAQYVLQRLEHGEKM